MADTGTTLTTRAGLALARHRGLALSVIALLAVLLIVLPLPPFAMDVLLIANITLAVLMLLTAINVASPLEFSVFPSLLLGATLLRLVLNVATTRLVLTAGDGGRTAEQAQYAAGHVVWAFGNFVPAGSLAVGVILFAVISIIQFVVITKGTSRISEVAARFMLDAMPGKQLAVDAELSGGLIKEHEARNRRAEIVREADFYGAMDGAGKFLRGDAVAAVLIVLVNVAGGLYVGVCQYGWDWGATVDLFTRLSIGDGLVMQLPAFVVSVSAALLVTRSTERRNLGDDMLRQVAGRPVVVAIAGLFLLLLALTDLPKGPLLVIGGGCVGLAVLLTRRDARNAGREKSSALTPSQRSAERNDSAEPTVPEGVNVQELLDIDPLRIDVGYGLIRTVDPSAGGSVLGPISALRKQLAQELGLLIGPVKIRDNMRLEAHAYEIHIRGSRVGAGRVYPRQLLAVGGDDPAGKLAGRSAHEPLYGAPAIWINPAQRRLAEMMNYTVVDAVSVLVTHLGEVIRSHAGEMLSRKQVTALVEGLRGWCPSLAAEVTARLPLGRIQKVLGNLLREGVSIRDMESIFEALADASATTQQVEPLTEHVRAQLGRSLSQRYCAADGKLWCVCLDPQTELAVSEHTDRSENGAHVSLPPDIAGHLASAVNDGLGRLRSQGRKPIVLCAPQIRSPLRKLLCQTAPDVAVLGYNEIDSVEVEPVANVGIEI